eukprot:191262_1
MDEVFGFDDPDFSDRVLRILEPDDRPSKRAKKESHPNSGGRLVHVCKWILCSQSGYFKTLLGKDFAESKAEEVEICVGKGETDAFIKLLHSFYFRALPDKNRKFSFEESPLKDLIKIIRLTDMFDAPSMVLHDVYQEISKRELTLQVCETLLNLPDHITTTHSFKSLRDGSISNCILKHFCQYGYKRVCKYSVKSLKLLLEHDELCITSEEHAWGLLMEWLWCNRRETISDKTVDSLLKCIRFEVIRYQYLTQIVAQWPHWFKTVQWKEILVAALARKDENDRRLLSLLGVEGSRHARTWNSANVHQ